MTIHIFNVFSCNAPWPFKMETGTVCTLVETDQGLVLIDTGPGQEDYAHPHGMLWLFRVIMSVPFDPQEAAVHQVQRLGFKPEDVRHVVLTHMHFDHCGGLPDFPRAKIHVHRREYKAFTGKQHRWTDMAYIQRHIAHQPDWVLYDNTGENWFNFIAIRLPFEPEMWLVPLHGHTWGQCGVAVNLENGWYFNSADAGAVHNDKTPAWLIKLVLGPHDGRLRRFMQDHPEVIMVNSHMWLDWFAKNKS
jgi:glyoxylase-like metal-dependent hydrolase (beta-lactamase superfamily II)